MKFIKDQTHFRREHQPLRDVGFLFCRGEHGATRTRALTGRIAEQLKMIACAQTFIDYCCKTLPILMSNLAIMAENQ
ncbi:hypothetical protein FBQ85_11780 [Cytophagia bacterium CHB2]|nr:hypothetical protein [Cytophagia bacterium CHB2]